MNFNVFLFFLLQFISAATSFSIAYFLLKQKDTPGSKSFAFLAIANLIWITGYLMEVGLSNLTLKIIGVYIEYFSIPFVSSIWLAGAIQISTNGAYPTKKEILYLFIIPIVLSLGMLTNHYHGLMYQNFQLRELNPFLILYYEPQFLYFVMVYQSYIFFFLGFIFLLYSFFKSRGPFKTQKILFLLSIIPPITANLLRLAGYHSFMQVDYTPASFTITCIIILWAYRKYGLFELIPAAKEIIFDSMHDVVIVCDTQFRIIDFNKQCHDIFGNKISTGERMSGAIPELRELYLSFADIYPEVCISNRIYEISRSPVKDKINKVIGYVYTFHDVTIRKQNEEKLLENEKVLNELNSAKDKLFSIISHDLQNPFQALLGYSEILKDDFSELKDSEKIEMIKNIHNVSKSAKQLLDSLLQWSRIQIGKVNITFSYKSISEYVNNILSLYTYQAELKKIKIIDNTKDSHFVYADEEMLLTILRNLLSNAIKFSYPGSEIVIESQLTSDNIIISITDSGVGISPKDASTIFLVKNTLSKSGTGGEKGTGLGLFLCKEFCNLLNGNIWVESIPDKGSKFVIQLSNKNNT